MPVDIRSRTRCIGQHRHLRLLVLAHLVGFTVGLFGGCGEDSEPPVATTRSAEHVIDVTISPGESPKLLSASAERFASAQLLPVRFGNALLVQRDAQDQIVDRTFVTVQGGWAILESRQLTR
jgi:hypothetical protein